MLTRFLVWMVLPWFSCASICAEEPGCPCQPRTALSDVVPVIVEGSVSTAHPAVGLFKTNSKPATATLVGKRTVITAAHCIDDGFAHEFVLDGKSYVMESAVKHPQYAVREGPNLTPLEKADHDVAIVRLKEEPPVTPAVLYAGSLSHGQRLTIVGLGETATKRDDRGVKRQTTNTVAELSGTKLRFNGFGSVCHGDSGGPSFVQAGEDLLLAGIHSVVSHPCGQYGVDARVDAYLPWIKQVSGGDVRIAEGK